MAAEDTPILATIDEKLQERVKTEENSHIKLKVVGRAVLWYCLR